MSDAVEKFAEGVETIRVKSERHGIVIHVEVAPALVKLLRADMEEFGMLHKWAMCHDPWPGKPPRPCESCTGCARYEALEDFDRTMEEQ